jgi:hypothetical protein
MTRQNKKQPCEGFTQTCFDSKFVSEPSQGLCESMFRSALYRVNPVRQHRSFPFTREVTSMKITKNLGMLLLAIYLILVGLVAFVPAIGQLGIVVSILAIIAGVLILLGK